MKPMVPTFDEACALAARLCNDSTMNVMQRSAAANILNFLERSAGPAFTTETPWFEYNGKLTPEHAADMEAGFYGDKVPGVVDEAVWINANDAARYTQLVASGDLTTNEVRALLRLPSKEDSE